MKMIVTWFNYLLSGFGLSLGLELFSDILPRKSKSMGSQSFGLVPGCSPVSKDVGSVPWDLIELVNDI